MKYHYFLYSLLLYFISFGANAQYLQQLQTANENISAAYAKKDLAGVLNYYEEEAVAMPEFHQMLNGRNAIKEYYSEWLRDTENSSREYSVTDVQVSNRHLIELGTFKTSFKVKGADTVVYNGKYLRVWKLNKDYVTIVSEIWGATVYLDRTKFPHISTFQGEAPVSVISRANEAAIGQRNQLITTLVKSRQGVEHASLFTQDAIYMPYYEPMKVGIDNVKAYFSEHEKPGDVNIDSLVIKAAMLKDLGNMVLEHGYYTVRWRAGDNSTGVVKGKSINIWKKDEKGKWMLFRQMVNHD